MKTAILIVIATILLAGCANYGVRDYSIEKDIVNADRHWCATYLAESKKLTKEEIKTVCIQLYPQPKLPWACKDLDEE